MLKVNIKDIAKERIEWLLNLADKVYYQNKDLSRRYVYLALRIARRARIKIPKELKWRICKKCFTLLKPGVNCRVRIRRGYIYIQCNNCGNLIRTPLSRRRKAMS